MTHFYNKFGIKYFKPIGYVVEPESISIYNHWFGGSSWNVVDEEPIGDGPALLFVLDLSDPKLSNLGINSLRELPICSYINSDVWQQEQVYKINYDRKEIVLLNKNSGNINVLDDEDRMPNPLSEKSIDLRVMKNDEYPLDEDSYWKNTDDFLGGKSSFRVAGNPLWLQKSEKIQCSCGKEMTHIMSIGYEGWGNLFHYIDEMPFFIGESALYVFFCGSCFELRVISQSS